MQLKKTPPCVCCSAPGGSIWQSLYLLCMFCLVAPIVIWSMDPRVWPSMEVYPWAIYRLSVHVRTATSGLHQTRLERVAFNWEYSCDAILTDAWESSFISRTCAPCCLQWLFQRDKANLIKQNRQLIRRASLIDIILFYIKMLRSWVLRNDQITWQDLTDILQTADCYHGDMRSVKFYHCQPILCSFHFWQCPVCCDLVNNDELQ